MTEIQNKRLAYPPKNAAHILGIGVTKLYQEIKEGRLRAKKFGKRTLITTEALSEWLDGLPGMREAE